MDFQYHTLTGLKKLLKKSIESEEYEICSQVKDEIKIREERGEKEEPEITGKLYIPAFMQNIASNENINEEDINDAELEEGEDIDYENSYSGLEPKDVLFNISILKESAKEEYGEYNETTITITPVIYFEQEGCVCDESCCDEVENILNTLGCYEIQDSTYELNSEITPKEIFEKLTEAGFVHNKEFDAFLDGCAGEGNEGEVIFESFKLKKNKIK